MKKTFIALLLVLAIVSVNVFADPITSNTNDATITVQTSVAEVVMFGVTNNLEANKLVADDFLSPAAFALKMSKNATTTITDISLFGGTDGLIIGYLQGYNNSVTALDVHVSATPLKAAVSGAHSGSIPLTVLEDNKTVTLPASANGIAGALKNSAILVKADAAVIANAPAGAYEATVTFTIVAE